MSYRDYTGTIDAADAKKTVEAIKTYLAIFVLSLYAFGSWGWWGLSPIALYTAILIVRRPALLLVGILGIGFGLM